MTRRDWLLHQLGITQWTLYRPAVLQGEVSIALPGYIRLLLIADKLPPLNHPLVIDVARSMALVQTQLYGMSSVQVMMLPDNIRCHCWWLGLDVLREFEGISFHTPILSKLAKDADAKRKLWRQIIDYEHHITTSTD